jgi:hypothetical protein
MPTAVTARATTQNGAPKIRLASVPPAPTSRGSALHSRYTVEHQGCACSHTHASETKAHVNHIRNQGGRNRQQRGEQGRLPFLSTCPPQEWGWNFRASNWTS